MFCLLVVLVELSVLAKWLARKTPLRKPNRGEGIISIKPRLKSVHEFLGLLYCFIVLLFICVVSCTYMIYYLAAMARYSLFVLKVLLNTKETNKQNNVVAVTMLCDTVRGGHHRGCTDRHHSTLNTSKLLYICTHWRQSMCWDNLKWDNMASVSYWGFVNGYVWPLIHILKAAAPCGLRGCKNGPAPFPGRMSYKATKPGLVCVIS